MKHGLNIIVPLSLEQDWLTNEDVVNSILFQNKKYGIKNFMLMGPYGSWRSVGYPPKEYFASLAERFAEIKKEVKPHGISLGWEIMVTVKSGRHTNFTGIVKPDGTESPFANCPLDENFRKCFAESVALFAKIAKPDYIMTEDDYGIVSAAPEYGCFCKLHLQEFSRREGRAYTREELISIFESETPEGYALLRRWRALHKDALVGSAVVLREELDKESPEIPVGYMKPGSAEKDGDVTEDICRALAGTRHTPFCRFGGTHYGGMEARDIPIYAFRLLRYKACIKGDFEFLSEADSFPHLRFFTSGAEMRTLMGLAYSYGYDGSTYQTQQLLDDPDEETIWGCTLAEESVRFAKVSELAKQCSVKGVELIYDTFWNYVDKQDNTPHWVSTLSKFGISYSAVESDVAFWDGRQAKYSDHETIMKYLAKGLFLDGDAAKILGKRGYGKYIGVELGEDITNEGLIGFDLGAREVIKDEFVTGKGKNMPSAFMFARGKNGIHYKMTVTDPKTEVITETYTFQKKLISVSMTRFQNELGGKIVTMGTTIWKNHSQSQYNYRRQRLIQSLINWCSDAYVYVKEAACVSLTVNKSTKPENSGFFGMFTLANLNDDMLESVELHLPPEWKAKDKFSFIDKNGELQPLDVTATSDGIIINRQLKALDPLYVVINN